MIAAKSASRRLLLWGIPVIAVAMLLIGIPVIIFLVQAFAGGPPVPAPPGDPVNERVARFQKDLAALAAGKRDRRDLRVSVSHDGKKITTDGAEGGHVYGHGPGVFGIDRPFALTKAQQDEVLKTLAEFPWQEFETGNLGDVGKSDAAFLGIHIRFAEWDKTISLATLTPQKSIYDAQGKPNADKIAQLGDKLRKLMQAAPRIDHAPLKDINDALTRIADGKAPEEWLTFGFQYAWKPDAKKADAPAKKNNAAADPVQPPLDRAEGIFLTNNGPIVWARKKNSGDLPTLVLPAKELRELATFLKEINIEALSAGLEKAPHPNPNILRFRRPGLADHRRWKTDFSFDVHILDKNLGFAIQDLEELAPQQRRPFEQIRERFEKLDQRIQRDGKVMTHI